MRDPRAGEAARRASAVRHALRFGRAGWWIANLGCERFGQNYRGRYLRLRYEDLARSPMRDLFAKLLPGSAWRADEIGGSDTRHQLYGTTIEGTPGLALALVAWRNS